MLHEFVSCACMILCMFALSCHAGLVCFQELNGSGITSSGLAVLGDFMQDTTFLSRLG